MPSRQTEFMRMVETHERQWGTNSYPQRPSLTDILNSPVVVFWEVEKERSFLISLHEELKDIEKFILRNVLLTRTPPARRRPVRIFQNQKRMTIKAIHIVFAEGTDDDSG